MKHRWYESPPKVGEGQCDAGEGLEGEYREHGELARTHGDRRSARWCIQYLEVQRDLERLRP